MKNKSITSNLERTGPSEQVILKFRQPAGKQHPKMTGDKAVLIKCITLAHFLEYNDLEVNKIQKFLVTSKMFSVKSS